MEDPENPCYLGRLARGIESNVENLREIRKKPGCHPDHVQALERVIEAQKLLLKKYGSKYPRQETSQPNG